MIKYNCYYGTTQTNLTDKYTSWYTDKCIAFSTLCEADIHYIEFYSQYSWMIYMTDIIPLIHHYKLRR